MDPRTSNPSCSKVNCIVQSSRGEVFLHPYHSLYPPPTAKKKKRTILKEAGQREHWPEKKQKSWQHLFSCRWQTCGKALGLVCLRFWIQKGAGCHREIYFNNWKTQVRLFLRESSSGLVDTFENQDWLSVMDIFLNMNWNG